MSIDTFDVRAQRVQIEADASAPKTVTNLGPDVVFYGDGTVVKGGGTSLAVGASVELTRTQHFVAASPRTNDADATTEQAVVRVETTPLSVESAVSQVVRADTTGVADATAIIQAAIDACPAGGVVLLPRGTYKLTAALTIDKSIVLRGSGVSAPMDSLNTTFAFDIPPTIGGTVLVQTAAGVDGIQITKAGAAVYLERFGIRFDGAHRFVNTGHGVNAAPSTTYSSGSDHGLFNFAWNDVAVFGHDGNHYAFRLVNPILGSLKGLRSWGGGIMQVKCDSHGGNYGNLVVDHPYGLLCVGGTAHGYSLEGRTGSGTSGVLNLITMVRPQCNSNATSRGGGAAVVTNAQYLFRADNPVSVSNLAVINPDFEAGATLANPVAFGSADTFIDPSGIIGAPSDTASKAFTVFRSEFGAKRLNSDMTVSNADTPGPSIAVAAGAGVGATASISGDDMRGTITLNTGTGPTAFSDLATITFGHIPDFATVHLIARGGSSGAANLYIRSKATASFKIGTTNVLPASTATLQWDYVVTR